MDARELGARLRAARERAGLRVEHLALAVDVTARTIVRWEAGEYALSVPQLYQWAETCGVTAADLLEGEAA